MMLDYLPTERERQNAADSLHGELTRLAALELGLAFLHERERPFLRVVAEENVHPDFALESLCEREERLGGAHAPMVSSDMFNLRPCGSSNTAKLVGGFETIQ